MAATIQTALSAYDIPSCAAAWQTYLQELMGVDHKLSIDGAPPATTLITTIPVSSILALGMALPPTPAGKTSPSVFDYIHLAPAPTTSVIGLWIASTILSSSVVSIVPALGTLDAYITALQPQTIPQLDSAIKAWLQSVVVNYTVGITPHTAVFVAV
jgi:hypothetical protein